MGLLDTGATVSVISSHVAEYLELRSASHTSLRGVHGTELAPIHIAKMTFRSGKRQREFIRGVFETRQRWNDEYSMLIGRDILQYGSLRMKGTWFSFNMSRWTLSDQRLARVKLLIVEDRGLVVS